MTFAHLPAVSRNLLYALTMAGCLLLLQSPASADVYKWLNENNEVQYTQMPPPPGIKYIRIQTNDHPSTDGDATGDEAPGEAQAAEGDATQTDAEALSEYEAEVARISKENCKIARNNLTQLNMGGHLRYRNEQGEYVTMTEEERQRRINEANAQIKEFCRKESE